MAKTLLIIGFVYPEPKSSAAGRRMLQLIDTFISYGYQITFATTAQKTKTSYPLADLAIDEVQIELNHASFNDFIQKLHPDIVLFDRFMTEEQFGWRVAKYCPKALRILDTEDLHFLRKAREKAFLEKQAFADTYLFNEYAKREIASIYRSDLSLIISEAEMALLKEKFKVPDNLIYYLPFLENPVEENIKTLPDFENRNHFVTIGTFLHNPNYYSVVYLKNTLWKLIKAQLPKAQLHIYGAHLSQKAKDLHHEKDGFIIKGFTDDVIETLSAYKVCLAPLPFGAGLKGKIIDAIKSGTPCVMSEIAAEGMFGFCKPNGFISDNPEEFAKKAVTLYTEKEIWKTAQENGFQVLRNRFSRKLFNNAFRKKLSELSKNLDAHRMQNFTGNMLQYHTLQSTKFMSKWIELKNKSIIK